MASDKYDKEYDKRVEWNKKAEVAEEAKKAEVEDGIDKRLDKVEKEI